MQASKTLVFAGVFAKDLRLSVPLSRSSGVCRTLLPATKPLQSHPYALRSCKPPGITSLRKTRGGWVSTSTLTCDWIPLGSGIGTSVLVGVGPQSGTDMPLSAAWSSDKIRDTRESRAQSFLGRAAASLDD